MEFRVWGSLTENRKSRKDNEICKKDKKGIEESWSSIKESIEAKEVTSR